MTNRTAPDMLPLHTITDEALARANGRSHDGGCTDCRASFTTDLQPTDPEDPSARVYAVLIAHDPTCPWMAGTAAANASVPTDTPSTPTTKEHHHELDH